MCGQGILVVDLCRVRVSLAHGDDDDDARGAEIKLAVARRSCWQLTMTFVLNSAMTGASLVTFSLAELG